MRRDHAQKWGYMYHFYVEPSNVSETTIRITGGDVNHMKNVLRMKLGEQVVLSDGNGREYICTINEMAGSEILVHIDSTRETKAELGIRLCLFQGLPKKDKMELIIQKAVELGVHEIVPVVTARTIVKIEDDKKESKLNERWQSIAEAAAKQSGRGIIPVVGKPVSYKEALKRAEQMDAALIPYEHAEGIKQTRETVKALHGKKTAAIFIGPEGGFDEKEIEESMKHGVVPITLGKRILRTETAGLAILSIIMFELEDE